MNLFILSAADSDEKNKGNNLNARVWGISTEYWLFIVYLAIFEADHDADDKQNVNFSKHHYFMEPSKLTQ